ncbi:hypothetical protein [Novosphingobium sp.]|uniref:hypothetical protein n=1 Tax=Novosphingobium sp. TaxID=1874826 RepID=UPI003B51D014
MKFPHLMPAWFKSGSTKRRLTVGFGIIFVLYIPRMFERVEAAISGGLPIPKYEPFPDPRAKPLEGQARANVVELVAFLRTRMEARHVSVGRANQLLWQFHYFVPVKYYKEKCRVFGIFDASEDPTVRISQIRAMTGVHHDFDARYSEQKQRTLFMFGNDDDTLKSTAYEIEQDPGHSPYPAGGNNPYGLSSYNIVTIMWDLAPEEAQPPWEKRSIPNELYASKDVIGDYNYNNNYYFKPKDIIYRYKNGYIFAGERDIYNFKNYIYNVVLGGALRP